MISVLRTTWPLLLGILLLMVGNGMQGTLLGIRGGIEGIGTFHMSVVMASYFGGFLAGSLIVPRMIQSVGHVRVFAALGSMISAVLILYPVAPDWIVWSVLRLLIGFSFCGVYITAESWLNASATNQNRGQALSAYMIVQMVGIITAQLLLNTADPAGFMLFVIPSVLVSLAFTPILLSARPAPQFQTIKRMSFGRLFRASPLGCVGIFLMGGVFSALFGMASVWGTTVGMSVAEISTFVAAIYVGGLALQFPIGWLSDRMDRRVLVLALSVLGVLTVAAVVLVAPGIVGLTLAGAMLGGVANPVYALLLAYTNDYLETSDMAAASAGLLFINGVGAMSGPPITGWLMGINGPDGFWIYIGLLLALLSGYAGWRMTRRSTIDPGSGYSVISPTATRVAVEVALEDNPHEPVEKEDEMDRAQEIVDFWLNQVGPQLWYQPTAKLDQTIRERFMADWQDAEALTRAWEGTAEGALAALILTDQFPRNMFRDDPRAFATDALAVQIAERAIAAGFDLQTAEPQRQFFYMPFEHAENLILQDRAVALFTERMPGENLRHAELHRDTIARFGRFPWRNATLNRTSSPEEQRVMDAGGYGALVSGKLSLDDV